ncbi:MAG: phosphoribosylamine--glycine ligase [Patescibacteria group bacterium]|jgi:phosphoribosylamine--glycine ligase
MKRMMVLGGKSCGAREHVMALMAEYSHEVRDLFCPGPNAGIAGLSKYRPTAVDPTDVKAVIRFALEQEIGLVLVGPEDPLVRGFVDRLQDAGIRTFGPTEKAAGLEGSKLMAKAVMEKAGVPTAPYEYFRKEQLDLAVAYVRAHRVPMVVKANGLAAGKGVTVCHDCSTAEDAIRACLERDVFGSAGHLVLVEEFLAGYPGLARPELSVLALVDRHGNFIMLPAAQDFKPVFDGDQGPNTGGMGAFSGIPWVSEAMMKQIGDRIFKPVIEKMKEHGMSFSGVLYAGLIWTKDGPVVVEFNVRFGDPEILPIFMRLKTDLIPVMNAIAAGESIANVNLEYDPRAAVTLVLVSNGYPDKYGKGFEIHGLDKMPMADDFLMVHAGTKLADGSVVETAGGRVIDPTVLMPDVKSGGHRLQRIAPLISWGDSDQNGPYWRRDIGLKVPSALPKL